MLKSPDVGRTYMTPELPSREAERKLFSRLYALSHDETRFVRGVETEGRLIGMIHEVVRDEDGVELGWFIDPAEWGRGFASEALAASIKTLFAEGIAWRPMIGFSE